MKRNHALKLLTLLSLATLPLGTVACSKGSSSPTEPAFDLEQSSLSASTASVSADSGKRRGRGGDDAAGDDNGGRGRGSDDGTGDDRGGRGRRGGRGGNDDTPRAPRNGQEFEGSVASVSQNTVVLANGTRVLVNAQTQWVARGDLHTLAQVSRAVSAGRPTRVEGRGTRQGNGSFVAATIKAEVDD